MQATRMMTVASSHFTQGDDEHDGRQRRADRRLGDRHVGRVHHQERRRAEHAGHAQGDDRAQQVLKVAGEDGRNHEAENDHNVENRYHSHSKSPL